MFEIFGAQLLHSEQFLYFLKKEGNLDPGKNIFFCLASDSWPAPELPQGLRRRACAYYREGEDVDGAGCDASTSG